MTVSGSGTKERTEDMLALALVVVCKQESEVARALKMSTNMKNER